MEWLQILTIIVANFGLFLWIRSESRSDYRHTDSILNAIKDEMKDFHGRLCAIEERNKGK